LWVLCQVAFSASGWPLAQRRPTERVFVCMCLIMIVRPG